MANKRVKRFDVDSNPKFEKTAQGYLRAKARVTRVGVFQYKRPDGSVLRELRHPDEVFKEDSLATLSGTPVTNTHPPELLTPENTSLYMKGFTSDKVDQDGKFVETMVTVTDADTISDAQNGKKEVSCGYTALLDFTPGEWEGEKYDCIQRDIVYNHVAIVPKGRAGREVSLLLDSDDMVEPTQSKETRMAKIKISGKSFECSEELKDAIDQLVETHDAKVEELTTEKKTVEKQAKDAVAKADSAQGRIDALTEEVKKVKQDSATTPDVNALVKTRLRLNSVAAAVLKDDEFAKIETLSNLDVQKKVILAQHPERKLDDKSEAYVSAQFDHIAEELEKNGAVAKAMGRKVTEGVEPGARESKGDAVDVASARDKYMKESQERSRKGFQN